MRSARGSPPRSAGCAPRCVSARGKSATIRTGADELHGLLLELQRHEFVQEPVPVSPRPIYGRLLVFARKAFYHLFFKWHARAVLQQQNGFNQSASRLLTELAARQKRAAEEGARLELRLRRLEQGLLAADDPDEASGREPAANPRPSPAGGVREHRRVSARIAICAAQIPFVRGGAEVLYESLRDELLRRGHQAEIVSLPFNWSSRLNIIQSALAWRLVDLTTAAGEPIDLVIATRFPSYLVQHPCKVVWLIHQFRQIYELKGTRFSDFGERPRGRRDREDAAPVRPAGTRRGAGEVLDFAQHRRPPGALQPARSRAALSAAGARRAPSRRATTATTSSRPAASTR